MAQDVRDAHVLGPQSAPKNRGAAMIENALSPERPLKGLIDTKAIDRQAAAGVPFGNSAYIHSCTRALYEKRLLRIAERVPVAADLVRTLAESEQSVQARYYGDPALR